MKSDFMLFTQMEHCNCLIVKIIYLTTFTHNRDHVGVVGVNSHRAIVQPLSHRFKRVLQRVQLL